MFARFDLHDPCVPAPLRSFCAAVVSGTQLPDHTMTLAPSALPAGRIRLSVFDGSGCLWFADPDTGQLRRGDPLSGLAPDDLSQETGGQPVDALYAGGGFVWIVCGACVYRTAAPPDIPPAHGDAPLQKCPVYFPKNSASVPAACRTALMQSTQVPDEPFLSLLGVSAVCGDGAGGRYLAFPHGVLHLSRFPAYDRRRAEWYAGGRYLYGADLSVCAVCSDGADGLWIENALGFVHIARTRWTLAEKAAWYDAEAWRLHAVRGSLCDVHCRPSDGGNGPPEPVRRYSTNNDALWSVLHAAGDAMRYTVLRAAGDTRGAEDAKQKLITVTENVLLQAHVHGFGNGFVCRGYVSARDTVFVKDGHIDTGGLWLKKGFRDADGTLCARCEDTALARFGRDDAEGRNFLLTDAVRRRAQTDADRLVTDTFRFAVPTPAAVPPRLARLYREADPVRPDVYPASADTDILFKTDTSSEEVVAAFIQYYFVWKHLLCDAAEPDDVELRALVRDTARATVTHLLDNGFALRDVHGNPTQWGKWFVDYFSEWETPGAPWRHPYYAYTDGPLNGAEWMCILRVAMLLFDGASGYEDIYARVQREYARCYEPYDGVTNGAGYAFLLPQYRKRLRTSARKFLKDPAWENYVPLINYSDEELAILVYWPLIELEREPARAALLRAGLDEWWDNMRRQGNPLYTYAYAALCPDADPPDFYAARDYLNRLPLRLYGFPVSNSTRRDLVVLPAPPGAEALEKQAQVNTLLPIDERRLHKFNSSPFTADADGAARADLYTQVYCYSGSLFTLPYWTARYYRLPL